MSRRNWTKAKAADRTRNQGATPYDLLEETYRLAERQQRDLCPVCGAAGRCKHRPHGPKPQPRQFRRTPPKRRPDAAQCPACRAPNQAPEQLCPACQRRVRLIP